MGEVLKQLHDGNRANLITAGIKVPPRSIDSSGTESRNRTGNSLRIYFRSGRDDEQIIRVARRSR